MSHDRVDWNALAGLGDPLRSVIDPSDVEGAKVQLIDRIHWLSLSPHLPRRGKVLDVGCGTGRLARRILQQGLDYYGADTSISMIDAARALNGPGNGQFRHYSGPKTPYPNGEFDMVLTVGVFQYLVKGPESDAFVEDLRRVVRPGGRLMMLEQASSSGGHSGTVPRSASVEDYVRELSSRFEVNRLERVRCSEFSRLTRLLLAAARTARESRGLLVEVAAAVENLRARVLPEPYFHGVQYFDFLLEARPS
jgi:SAM-dependent methyltransferase